MLFQKHQKQRAGPCDIKIFSCASSGKANRLITICNVRKIVILDLALYFNPFKELSFCALILLARMPGAEYFLSQPIEYTNSGRIDIFSYSFVPIPHIYTQVMAGGPILFMTFLASNLSKYSLTSYSPSRTHSSRLDLA